MRLRVRELVSILLAGLSLVSSAQTLSGTYVPAGAVNGVLWSINNSRTLMWNGVPYLPIGIRVDGSESAIKAAKAAGIKDLLIDLPASGSGWNEAFSALRSSGQSFVLRVNSLAPTADGFSVEPDAYRIAGITKPQTITVNLPGAKSAFVVLASRRDGSVAMQSRLPIVEGKLEVEAKPSGLTEHVLLIYPETKSGNQADFWEGFDAHRDAILAALRRSNPGAGLRAIVNPVGQLLPSSNQALSFVPTSRAFQMELEGALEEQYHAVSTLQRSWGIGANDLTTFAEMARLVPLWHGSRGVGFFLDPQTNRTYLCDNRHSTAWRDLALAVTAAGNKRYSHIVSSIRKIANVPVIQEWMGWETPYEGNAPLVDGIGMRTRGTGTSALLDSGSRATSSILRWDNPGLLLASDIDLDASPDGNPIVAPNSANDPAGKLPQVLDDLGSLGARGFFVRANSAAEMKAVADEATKRQADVSLATATMSAIYFPENARNPASPQKLPGGKWWLPCPNDGNRIDLGSLFWAYQLKGAKSDTYAIWARNPGRYVLRYLERKKPVFQALDGHDPEPKIVKNGVEISLGQYPVIITGTEELPVPELAFVETVFQADYLFSSAEQRHVDATQELVSFRDYGAGFDRSPSGNFVQLRQLLRRLGDKVGDVTVLEGEKSLDSNFSDAPFLPGCIGNSALVLKSALPPGPDGYYANYSFQTRSLESQDVWIAAAIPPEFRKLVTITVNGQVMSLTNSPVSFYGDGFGWYKVGSTKLSRGISKIHVQVSDSVQALVALDAIVLTPRPFFPDGISLPNPIPFPDMRSESKGKKGRGN